MNDSWVHGEPVIRPDHAAFIVMGGTLILKHHYEAPDWSEWNRNYYGTTMAESDDAGFPYFAAFLRATSLPVQHLTPMIYPAEVMPPMARRIIRTILSISRQYWVLASMVERRRWWAPIWRIGMVCGRR